MRFVLIAIVSTVLSSPALALGAPREPNLGVHDVGIFSDLDPQVQLALPVTLRPEHTFAIVDRAHATLVLYEDDWPIKIYPLTGARVLRVGDVTLALREGDEAELASLLSPERVLVLERAAELPPGDADGDGIPDPLDVLIGARKAALNADRYDGRYERIAYPNGDVPRTIGVCTDVVVRALRNAGLDLQREVHEDILRAPKAYPMIAHPNSDIDHRRVKSLLPYFSRHFDRRSSALADPADRLRPGDIVFMDTFPSRPGSEHVGIVGDRQSAGRPLVINNWTDGTVTREMDLFAFVPVTHRFRIPARLVARGPIAAYKTQLITVVSERFDATTGELRRYEREPGGSWRAAGAPAKVVLGYAGYGWGDGLHGRGAPRGRPGPVKREGDGRSPAGVFELGTLYGYAASRPDTIALPYASAMPGLRCIDDPSSPDYNRIVSGGNARSAETMQRADDLYELALYVEHNRAPVTPGDGSCIFMHVWTDARTPVTGCTAMDKDVLRTVLGWLRPNAAVLVALPASEYRALAHSWSLP